MIYARFLWRLYATRLLGSLLALAALLSLVDLMERSDQILARGLGGAGLVRHAALRAPVMLATAFPIAALVAPVLVLAGLAGRGEIAALRAAGMPVGRLVIWLVPVSLAAGLGQFLLDDRALPAADSAFARWWGPAEESALWFRDGPDVVGVTAIAAGGRMLRGIEVLRRRPDGLLGEVVLAEQAQWSDGRWALLDGTRQSPTGSAQPFARLIWGTVLSPANMAELTRADAALPVARLVDALAGRWATRQGPATLATRLHHAVARPLVPVLLLLLALPVARGTVRGGGIPTGMAMGLAAGLSYLLLDGILVALGETGALPPVLAGWAAHAIVACMGGALLANAEG